MLSRIKYPNPSALPRCFWRSRTSGGRSAFNEVIYLFLMFSLPTCLYLHLFLTYIFFSSVFLPNCLYLHIFITFISCAFLFPPDLPTIITYWPLIIPILAKRSPLAENLGQNVRTPHLICRATRLLFFYTGGY